MARLFRMDRLLRIHPTTSPHTMLRILAFTIIASFLFLSLLIGWNRARQIDATAAQLITQKATIARSDMVIFFRPIMSQLGIIQTLGRRGFLDPSDQASFQELWPPLMAPLDQQVDSVTVMNSEARQIHLSRSGLDWEIRTSKLIGPGIIPSWYMGALEIEEPNRIFWDGPTTASNGNTGVTASIAWTDGGDDPMANVVAFHVKPEVVERFIRELPLGEAGEVLLLRDPESVVRFSLAIDGYVEMTARATFFSVLAEGKDTPLFSWLKQLDNDTTVPKPFQFTRDGERWWAAASSLRVGERTNWVGVAMPEKALFADLQEEQLLLLYILLAVLAAGVVALVALARQYGSELQQVRERPKFSEASEEDIQALIHEGEQERLELKSTLRWNLKANKPGNEVARAWLKTLVAFLNTEGGTLLIGVADDGEILGIEADGFSNEDKYLLHFNNLIKQHIGLELAAHLSVAIRSVGEKRILVVDSERSSVPVFLRYGDEEEFFIRVGSGTRRLPTSKVLEYVEKRASA